MKATSRWDVVSGLGSSTRISMGVILRGLSVEVAMLALRTLWVSSLISWSSVLQVVHCWFQRSDDLMIGELVVLRA